jgi:transposase
MTMTKPSNKKTTYVRHSREYKAEALKLISEIGVAKAAKQLGLHESQLYNWREDCDTPKR